MEIAIDWMCIIYQFGDRNEFHIRNHRLIGRRVEDAAREHINQGSTWNPIAREKIDIYGRVVEWYSINFSIRPHEINHTFYSIRVALCVGQRLPCVDWNWKCQWFMTAGKILFKFRDDTRALTEHTYSCNVGASVIVSHTESHRVDLPENSIIQFLCLCAFVLSRLPSIFHTLPSVRCCWFIPLSSSTF